MAVSGNLDFQEGGSILSYKDRAYVANTSRGGDIDYDRNIRAVYVPVVRSSMYDVFRAFDLPDPSVPNGDRDATVVAPQALFMMNGSVVLTHSRKMAESLLKRSDLDDAARVREALDRLSRAGITTLMLTGDQERTARAIGEALGIPPENVHSRVTPSEASAASVPPSGEKAIPRTACSYPPSALCTSPVAAFRRRTSVSCASTSATSCAPQALTERAVSRKRLLAAPVGATPGAEAMRKPGSPWIFHVSAGDRAQLAALPDDADRVFATEDALLGDHQRIVLCGFGIGRSKVAAALDLADAD